MEVIYYSDGSLPMFETVLRSALDHVPKERINLITKSTCEDKIRALGVRIHQADEYASYAGSFYGKYEHLSSNPFHFELACLARWHCIYDFVIKNDIHDFLVCDWDVLLFDDPVRFYHERVKGKYHFTYQNKVSLGLSFWSSTEPLAALLSLINSHYEKKSALNEKIRSVHAEFHGRGLPGGISDMYFASLLIRSRRFRTMDTTHEVIEDAIWENNCRIVDGWETEKLGAFEVKKLSYACGSPFCFSKHYGANIRLRCVHCTPPLRPLIEKIYHQAKASAGIR